MRPKLELLDKPLIERILDEAIQLIEDPGVRVAPYVEDLLRAAGITVTDGVAHIPEALARRLLDLVPRGFCLYDRLGRPAVHYGGDTRRTTHKKRSSRSRASDYSSEDRLGVSISIP